MSSKSSHNPSSPSTLSFKDLNLPPQLLSALADLGYETATPVQGESIPALMQGGDLSAQAQTGTGKTASFALPILAQLDLKVNAPQAIIIAPTRELAIQVAEAFQSYAKHLKGFRVAPIYGGQDYNVQLRALKRGVHVIVGTPGRTMDHLRRGTLSIKAVKTVVLDEADEMLKMGFIEDIEWILDQIPQQHQTALFSATMPDSILRVAKRYLTNPKKIHIKPTENTTVAIEQSYIRVSRNQKMDVLTHYLELEEVDAAIIFSRTKNYSSEVAEKLKARGYAAAALNGDMNQAAREKVLKKVKNREIDIIVATDVAARGIDIDRVSHVINFDIPSDVESYTHRIGRTGRAGRQGKALLFVAARERRLLNDIERAMGPIQEMVPPSLQEMQERHSKKLADKVIKAISKKKKLVPYYEMIEKMMEEGEYTEKDIAAGLAFLIQQSNPIPSREIELDSDERGPEKGRGRRRSAPFRKGGSGDRPARKGRGGDSKGKKRAPKKGAKSSSGPKKGRKRNSGKSRSRTSK